MASNSVSQGVKVGILALLMAVGTYTVWKSLGEKPSGSDGYILTAKFKNAKGLQKNSNVEIAGVPIGEIVDVSIEGRYARVRFRIRRNIKVYSNAVVYKRASSLLGGYYLELDPGHPESPTLEGTTVKNPRLGIRDNRPEFQGQKPNDDIELVREATSPEELMRSIQDTLPTVERTLNSMTALSEDVRELVNVPIRSAADRINSLVQTKADDIESVITRLDRTMGNIERVSRDLREASDAGKIQAILDNLDSASQEAKNLMTDTNREIKLTGTKVREKLDMVDQILDSSGSIAKKIDGDEGTLGRLVNDPTIADNVEEVTEDLNQFIGTLTNLKTYVGLRGEFDMYSKLSRFYLQVEIQTRSDAGYLVEISKGPRGGYPRTTLEFDPRIDPNNYYRTVEIDDKMRFTFQIMKRFQWATFRYGLKDSTGGAGLDIATAIFGKKLTLQLDVFDPAWNRLPRVKGTAILQMWRNIYILGGVDDALNTPATLPIVAGNIAVPGRIDTMRYGRDYFVGAMLRFDDRDLAALLTVAGGFLSGATGGS